MTALVTGADGFVGRHLVAALVQAGRSVRATDLQFGTDLPDGVEARVADILDAAAMASAMDGVETVYHLAAISDLWTPARDADQHHRVNVTGTKILLEAAIAAGARRFVYCSSNVALITGPRRAMDVDETYRVDRAALFGAYARSKHDAEALVSRAADRIEVVIARPGTPIGPGDHRPTPPGRLLRDLANGTLPALPMGGSINLVDVRLLAD
ncbi:MAG: NAD-dependent epimerase/dehydratase family protein, partial [Pseudomonadota bacterium]